MRWVEVQPHTMVFQLVKKDRLLFWMVMLLAWAVCEHLHNVSQCRTLFATHYHELTQLENELDQFACKSLAIQESVHNNNNLLQGFIFD